MSDGTKIEWTEATWNPITGCSVTSPGCTNCYAMKLAGTRLGKHPSRAGLTQDSKAGPVWTGEVRFNEQWLDQPLRWKRPRMIFVCAHGDLFHENVPDEWIDRVFAVMALAPQHTFQVLTKRSARMREYLTNLGYRSGFYSGPRGPSAFGIYAMVERWQSNFGSPEFAGELNKASMSTNIARGPNNWPLPNVWLGVSVEDQARADERIPDLLSTPAAVRWLSCEPLLGPVEFEEAWHGEDALDSECWGECAWCEKGLPPLHNCQQGRASLYEGRWRSGLDWIVAGGESGPGARPMHPDWARSLRDQCAAAGVPFFFKQWGEWVPECHAEPLGDKIDGCGFMGWTGDRYQLVLQESPFPLAFRVGKKRAGRLLDGATHDAMPKVAA